MKFCNPKFNRIKLQIIRGQSKAMPADIGRWCISELGESITSDPEVVEVLELTDANQAYADTWLANHKNEAYEIRTYPRGTAYELTCYAAEYYEADEEDDFVEGSDYDTSEDIRPALLAQRVIDEWEQAGGALWIDTYPEPQLYTTDDADDIDNMYCERSAEYETMSKEDYIRALARKALEWAGLDEAAINKYMEWHTVQAMSLRETMRAAGMTQRALAKRFGIPLRTVENWCCGANNCPDYTLKMIQEILLKK